MTEHATTYKELSRSRDDRMIAGVSGGLGKYFNVNPVFYRVGFVVLTLIGGAGLLIYGAAMLVFPNEGEQDSMAADILRNHRQRPIALIGLGLVALAGISLLSHISFRIHSGAFWAVVLIVGASLLWAQRHRADPVAPPPVAPAEPVVAPAEPAAVVPVVVARRRRSVLGIVLGTIGLLMLAAVVASIAFVSVFLHVGDGVGHRSYQPIAPSALEQQYRLGVGDLELDLSRLDVPAGVTTIHARVGIGHLHVIVPPGVTIRTHAHVSWGDANILGNDQNGHDVRSDIGDPAAQIVLDGNVGLGQIEVTRSVR
jgi:phage shock protein PspC (stress-responsive transcriptional regulator)